MRFITEQEAIFLNALLIVKYTPSEQKGVKDHKLLDSALNRPKATAFGEDAYPTLWLKGAAMFASLVQNHAFHNANKRTGFACMKQFLWLNGYIFDLDQKEAEDYTVFIVENSPPIEYIADWMESNSEKRP